jgi:ankyrin repeat protein
MKKTIWARILASFAASTCLSFAARLDNSMDSALFDAIHQGNVASVRKLLLQGANPNAKDAEGTPALMQCAVYSNVEHEGAPGSRC